MKNDYCKIYIDGDCSKPFLIDALLRFSGGQIEGRASIRTATCVMDVEDNDDFDEVKRTDPTDGFLSSRYYVDVEPRNGYERTVYVHFLLCLLTRMKQAGFTPIPACNFEEELSELDTGKQPEWPHDETA